MLDDNLEPPVALEATSAFEHHVNSCFLSPRHTIELQNFLYSKNYISGVIPKEAFQNPEFLYLTTCDALYDMLKANGFATGDKYKKGSPNVKWNRKGFYFSRRTTQGLQAFLLATNNSVAIVANESEHGLWGETTINALQKFCELCGRPDTDGQRVRDAVAYEPDEVMIAVASVAVEPDLSPDVSEITMPSESFALSLGSSSSGSKGSKGSKSSMGSKSSKSSKGSRGRKGSSGSKDLEGSPPPDEPVIMHNNLVEEMPRLELDDAVVHLASPPTGNRATTGPRLSPNTANVHRTISDNTLAECGDEKEGGGGR